jgi:large subunit ribosomal protein L15
MAYFSKGSKIMQLHDLRPAEGATKKRKRVGRGTGSGKGKTATRGTKGQNARTGGGVRLTFEGGQLPLVKRLPKMRGFNNRYRLEFTPVNVDVLDERFVAGSEVTPAVLSAANLVENPTDLVVVLARGEVNKPLHLKIHRISGTARQKIEAAGGTIELLPYSVNRNLPRS